MLSAFQTASAVSPIPFLSTSSRAIAESMSSSSSMLCNPSPANLPSMVSATSSFFPMRRKHDVCMVPSQQRNFTRTGRRCPILHDRRLAWRKVCSEYPDSQKMIVGKSNKSRPVPSRKGSTVSLLSFCGCFEGKHYLTQGLKVVHQVERLQLQRAEYLCQRFRLDTF